MARPDRKSKRTPEIVEFVIERVTAGQPLASVLRTHGMPSVSAWYDWLDADKELDTRFARAREHGHDAIAAEALEISNTPIEAITETVGPDGTTIKREDALGHRKLQIETRLKLLAKWDRRYSERATVEHTGKLTLESLVTGDGPKE